MTTEVPLRGSDGRIIEFMRINSSITDRKQAQETLKKSEEKYRVLAEKAGEAILVVQGKLIRYVNPKFLELTGYSRDEIATRPFEEFIHPDDREMVVERYQKRLIEEASPHIYSFRAIDKDGSIKWAEVNVASITWEGRPAILAFLNDITERKRTAEELQNYHAHLEELVQERTAKLTEANRELQREIVERKRVEEELRKSQEKLKAQYNGIPVPTYAWQKVGEDFILVDYNDAAVALTRGNVMNCLGMKASEMYQIEPEIREELFRCFVEKTSTKRDTLYRFRGTGESKYLAVKYAFVPPDMVLVHTEDITERKRMEEELRKHRDQLEELVEERTAELKAINKRLQQEITERGWAEEQLRSLAYELSLAEEHERRRIAVELHDHIGQDLAICEMKLGELKSIVSSAHTITLIDEIRRIIDSAIQNTRSLAFELSSLVLYELGLEAAAADLVDHIQERHGIMAGFEDDGQPKPLHDDVRVFLFQALRELLLNVVKHAQARNVNVSVHRDKSEARMTVEDDGIGFDISRFHSRLYRNKGFGLINIRERLNHFGGRIEVRSELGNGTQVTLIVPLKLKENEKE